MVFTTKNQKVAAPI